MTWNSSGLAVNVPLTNLVIGYNNEDTAFIADKIFKPCFVPTKTGTYYEYGKENLRQEDTALGNRGIANIVTDSVTATATYLVNQYGLKTFISDEELMSTLPSMRQQFVTSSLDRLRQRLMIDKEVVAAGKLFNTTTFTSHHTALSGTDRWDNQASNMFGTISSKAQLVRLRTLKQTGLKLIIGSAVWDAIQIHPDALARSSAFGIVREVNTDNFTKMLKPFGIDEVIVGEAGYNNTVEGQTDSISRIWGKYAMICYIDPSQATINNSTVCKNFTYENNGIQVTKFKQSPEEKGFWHRVETSYDLRTVKVDNAELLSTVVS